MPVKDAFILEHQLDQKIILQFNRFAEFITDTLERPRLAARWTEMFEKYCEEDESEENSFRTSH